MSENKLVSVIMNCHNGSTFLNESISSLINQTYTNWELIFWDNRSTDNSVDIIKNFNDSRIKIFESKIFEKLGKARNNALLKCSGEIIGFLDTDDIWCQKKIEKQIPLFNNKDIGLVYCNSIFFKDSKTRLLYKRQHKLPKGNDLNKIIADYNLSLETVMIKRS